MRPRSAASASASASCRVASPTAVQDALEQRRADGGPRQPHARLKGRPLRPCPPAAHPRCRPLSVVLPPRAPPPPPGGSKLRQRRSGVYVCVPCSPNWTESRLGRMPRPAEAARRGAGACADQHRQRLQRRTWERERAREKRGEKRETRDESGAVKEKAPHTFKSERERAVNRTGRKA